MKVACIVAAAGKGKRLRSKVKKPYVKLGKLPILAHSLMSLHKNPRIDDIALVVSRDDLSNARSFIKKYAFRKVKYIVGGGKTRSGSVRNALRELEKDSKVGIILIHDGARPYLEKKIVNNVINAAERFGSAICAVPIKATIKKVGHKLIIKETPGRKFLWEAQTPQAFRRDIILKAYKKAWNKNVTDDASLVERMGYKVKAVMGSYKNIKITTPEDLKIVKALMKVS